jgi:hypothetical protein
VCRITAEGLAALSSADRLPFWFNGETRGGGRLTGNADSPDRNYSLRYGAAAKSEIRSLLDSAVRPHLHDVRAMLRLPLPDLDISAGCNFAALHVLLNVLSGLSRLMGPGPKHTERHFREFTRRWYPWNLEPRGGYSSVRGTNALYGRFRNGFSHDLGLSLEELVTSRRPNRPRRVRLRFRVKQELIAVRKQPSLSSSQLLVLDDVETRPLWLGPTVINDTDGSVVVDVLAVYWGVRRLIFDHTQNQADVRSLQHMIEKTWARKKKAKLVDTIKRKESGELLFNDRPVSPAELTRRLRARQSPRRGMAPPDS